MQQRQPPAGGQFDLQGHRGARGLWPENTLAGFARTLALGVSTFELDCAVTRDAVVVISHDPQPNPDHTRDAQGRFLAAPGTADLLPKLRAAAAVRRRAPAARQRIRRPVSPSSRPWTASASRAWPTCSSWWPRWATRRFGSTSKRNCFPRIRSAPWRRKPSSTALLGAVRGAGMQSRTTIQCFDWQVLKLVQRLAPDIATGALTDQQGEDDTVYLGRAVPSPWLGGLNVHDFGDSVPQARPGERGASSGLPTTLTSRLPRCSRRTRWVSR